MKEVVTTIRQGIFCGQGHLFYIQVRNLNKSGYSEFLYPSTQTDNTFKYMIRDENVYAIDIKDLSGNQITDNLYVYESDGTLVTGLPNPFNLTRPRLLGDKGSHGPIKGYLPYGIRLYAFSLAPDDNKLKLILKDATNRVVLKLKFYFI
jgi:hypothetical protein